MKGTGGKKKFSSKEKVTTYVVAILWRNVGLVTDCMLGGAECNSTVRNTGESVY
jgi:hypothetical protein